MRLRRPDFGSTSTSGLSPGDASCLCRAHFAKALIHLHCAYVYDDVMQSILSRHFYHSNLEYTYRDVMSGCKAQSPPASPKDCTGGVG